MSRHHLASDDPDMTSVEAFIKQDVSLSPQDGPMPVSSTEDSKFASPVPMLAGGVKEMPAVRPIVKSWTPIPLRRWFILSLLAVMLLTAAGLEIALHFSNTNNGWKVSSRLSATSGIMHYVYTLPPVAVAMVIVALWAWTDMTLRKFQPYIDLAYGNAPASKTMLLDYSDKHAAVVSLYAYRHSHYLVALSSFMVLVGLAIQPLAASLFTVKEAWWSSPNLRIQSFEQLGLDPNFTNLTAFSTAAGFVQANVLYNATPPNFVHDIWAIAAIDVPNDRVDNGTMLANTSSIRSLGHCTTGENSNLAPFPNGTGFTITGSSNGCPATFSIPNNIALQYGVDVVTCPTSAPPDPFKPVVFWTFFQPLPNAEPALSLVYCNPTIELLTATTEVALQTGELQKAAIISNYTQPNNITDPNGLVQGRAMNGVGFNLGGADSFVRQRAQDARTGLTTAVVQKAILSSGGLQSQMQSSGMANITESIYDLYLSLIARQIYFVPGEGTLEVGIITFQPRLFMVGVTVHILTTVLVVFAALSAMIHILHHRTRDLLVLPRNPGTLATAAAFTARSNVGDVLDGYLDGVATEQALKNRRFRLDRDSGRIVMEGHVGYEDGTTIPENRRSGVYRLFNSFGSR